MNSLSVNSWFDTNSRRNTRWSLPCLHKRETASPRMCTLITRQATLTDCVYCLCLWVSKLPRWDKAVPLKQPDLTTMPRHNTNSQGSFQWVARTELTKLTVETEDAWQVLQKSIYHKALQSPSVSVCTLHRFWDELKKSVSIDQCLEKFGYSMPSS